MNTGPKLKADKRTATEARIAAQAVNKLKRLHDRREAALKAAEKATWAEYEFYVVAKDAGLTYAEIAEVVDKATITIIKEIQRQRGLDA